MKRAGKAALVIFCLIIIYWYSDCSAYASAAGTDAQKTAADTANKTCIISFDGNGANANVATQTVTFGDYYGTLPELTRPNYVFIGWYSYRDGGIKITETTKVIKPTDHKLYAHWRGNPVEVELKAAGGELRNTKVTVYYGTKFLGQLPTPTRASYQFEGWFTAETGGDKITIKSIYGEKGPKTLYAHWTEKPVKVIFISFNGENNEKIVSYGKEYGELPEPEKEGYIFKGWYLYKDYRDHLNEVKNEITATTIVNEISHVKLYARWYPDPEAETPDNQQ